MLASDFITTIIITVVFIEVLLNKMIIMWENSINKEKVIVITTIMNITTTIEAIHILFDTVTTIRVGHIHSVVVVIKKEFGIKVDNTTTNYDLS